MALLDHFIDNIIPSLVPAPGTLSRSRHRIINLGLRDEVTAQFPINIKHVPAVPAAAGDGGRKAK